MNTLTPLSSAVLPNPQGPSQHSRPDPVLIPKHTGWEGSFPTSEPLIKLSPHLRKTSSGVE